MPRANEQNRSGDNRFTSSYDSIYKVIENAPALRKVYEKARKDSEKRRKKAEKEARKREAKRPIVPAQPIALAEPVRKIDRAAVDWLNENGPEYEPANAPTFTALTVIMRERKRIIASVRYRLRSVGIK